MVWCSIQKLESAHGRINHKSQAVHQMVILSYCFVQDSVLTANFYFTDVFKFRCPTETPEVAATHPRYADADDCQHFFVCINGDTPRRNGCKLGQAFDEKKKRCEWAKMVPEW
jgi:Chitin binding Peritrophin-A domain